MIDPANKSTFGRNVVIFVVLVSLLGGAIYAIPKLYRRYEPTRLAKRARAYADQGDVINASLTIQRSLSINSNDLATVRLVAELAEKNGDRQAVPWRGKLVALEPESAQARIECADAALRFDEPDEAKRVLDYENETAVAKSHPRFHELSGRTARSLRKPTVAMEHFTAALAAAPQNEINQLNHAIALLERGWIEERPAARATLERVRTVPACRVPALRALVRDSAANFEHTKALELARELAADAGAEFPDRVTLLDLLRRSKHAEFAAALTAAKEAARDNPQRIATLLLWMNRNGLSSEAIAWFDGFTEKEWSDTRICAAGSLCALEIKNWPLVEALAQGKWGRLEFVRLTLLAQALREQGKPSDSYRNWENAIAAASRQPGAPTMLTKMIADWGWTSEEVEPLLLATVDDTKADDQFLKSILPHLTKEKDTRALRQVMARLVSTDPANEAAENNYAVYSLLLGENLPRATEIAERLYRKHSRDRRYASTYAFALHVNGQSKKALEVLSALPSEDLEKPDVAVYYGIILAAAGDPARAIHFLNRAKASDLLPEEEKLVGLARQAAK